MGGCRSYRRLFVQCAREEHQVHRRNLEHHVVLEALAWGSCLAAKDIADLYALLTITHEHRGRFPDRKPASAPARTGGFKGSTQHRC